MSSASTTKRLVEVAIAEARESSNGWWRVNCPICPIRTGKSDSRLSLAFHPETGRYRCMRCQIYGKLRGQFHDMVGSGSSSTPDGPMRLDKPEEFLELGRGPGLTALTTAAVREILRRRGVPENVWAQAQIGVCFSGEMAYRVVVPITDPADRGSWIGYVGRALDGREPKYLYPKPREDGRRMVRGKMLFNGRALLRETDEPIIVVEGIFDALPHWPHTVACLGKPTREQLEMLWTSKRPIVVCLDGDAWSEGLACARKIALERLSLDRAPDVASIRMPPQTDPGNLHHGTLIEHAWAALHSDDQPYEISSSNPHLRKSA